MLKKLKLHVINIVYNGEESLQECISRCQGKMEKGDYMFCNYMAWLVRKEGIIGPTFSQNIGSTVQNCEASHQNLQWVSLPLSITIDNSWVKCQSQFHFWDVKVWTFEKVYNYIGHTYTRRECRSHYTLQVSRHNPQSPHTC